MKSYITVTRKTIKRNNRSQSIKYFSILLLSFMFLTTIMAGSDVLQVDISNDVVTEVVEASEDLTDIELETTQYTDKDDVEYNRSSQDDMSDANSDNHESEELSDIGDTNIEFISIIAEDFKNAKDEEELYIEEEQDRELNISFTTTSDINNYSGLSIDEISRVLEDYPRLQPYADDFFNIEQRDKVNVLFAIAVTVLESDHGRSNIATTKNNLFGFMYNGSPKSYSSKEECIDYFGRLISKNYIGEGLSTPSSISYKYEPKDPEGWAYKVTQLMNQIAGKV